MSNFNARSENTGKPTLEIPGSSFLSSIFWFTGCRRLKHTSGIDLPEVSLNCILCVLFLLTCLENAWNCLKMFETNEKLWDYSGGILDMFGTCLEMLGFFWGTCWELLETCLGHVDHILGQNEICVFVRIKTYFGTRHIFN